MGEEAKATSIFTGSPPFLLGFCLWAMADFSQYGRVGAASPQMKGTG